MKNIGNWFKQLGKKLITALRHFMQGRYGMDKLNLVLLWVSVAVVFASMFLPGIFGLLFTILAYVLMGLAIFRTLSRNTYKRYRENRRFLRMIDRIKDREHRYYSCPKCRQPVRVPKGKGKISITCPKCKEKFIKKT